MFNVVAFVDLSKPDNVIVLAMMMHFIEQSIPIRFGFVTLTDPDDPESTSIFKIISVSLGARVLWDITANRSKGNLKSFVSILAQGSNAGVLNSKYIKEAYTRATGYSYSSVALNEDHQKEAHEFASRFGVGSVGGIFANGVYLTIQEVIKE